MTAPSELAKIDRELLAREQRLSRELERTRAAMRERQSRRDDEERKRQRAIENKQKILLGAWLLDTVGIDELVSEIDDWLTRPADREVFGLPPRNAAPDAPATENVTTRAGAAAASTHATAPAHVPAPANVPARAQAPAQAPAPASIRGHQGGVRD